MRSESRLQSSLRQVRTRLGMSQQELATLAGVTRQTISGAEASLYAPSATVALKLARALGCRVEELFWLEEERPLFEAYAAPGLPEGDNLRVAVAQVGERWVAHPLTGEQAFRTETIPADGEGFRSPGSETVSIRLLDEPQNLLRTVVLAGCTPALSLWARAAERWNPGLRVHWIYANSTAALRALRRGEVHGAGSHLYDDDSGEHNAPFVRRLLPDKAAVLINLGVWAEGIAVRPANPKAIASVADLAQPGVTIINREPGAGCRLLLDRELQARRIPPAALSGYRTEAPGHLEVARAVAAGQADAGILAESVAVGLGLGFIPLRQVRYDMVFLQEHLQARPVRELVNMLAHRWVRSQLQSLGGFDTSLTGEVVAEVAPGGGPQSPAPEEA